ncbi:hypothetical protein, partial [Vibrio sp. Vb0877]|uniref:hypothetical protein n=1 Tax=Vibrio sp. Vb0877 TaxID=2816073 RepID=UPI001A8C6A89
WLNPMHLVNHIFLRIFQHSIARRNLAMTSTLLCKSANYRQSSQTAFPEGVIQAYPVPYVTQYQFRCPL